MASISNVDLDVKKGRKFSTLIVTYKICFTKCEVKAGFYFSDYAEIWGSDPGPDDLLLRVGSKKCYKATKNCQVRKYVRKVANSRLNEDGGFLWWGKRDEIYAKACVTPVAPKSDCANSTLHYDFF